MAGVPLHQASPWMRLAPVGTAGSSQAVDLPAGGARDDGDGLAVDVDLEMAGPSHVEDCRDLNRRSDGMSAPFSEVSDPLTQDPAYRPARPPLVL